KIYHISGIPDRPNLWMRQAFDSIEFNAILKALAEQGINMQYISLLKEANTGCTIHITLSGWSENEPLRNKIHAIRCLTKSLNNGNRRRN
uniref:Uncharacterized protein n=1 Tax=Chelonoidis abingdonii TaxID=106734 RepID=A0A8C0GP56_CHEAB